jgi:NTE family protein
VFSKERHGGMALAEAVRISMSIPLFFAAVRYGADDDVYVDGGVIRNYPIKLFDRERYIDTSSESYAVRLTDYYNRENALFSLHSPGRSLYLYNRQTLGLRLDKSEEIGLFRYDEPSKRKRINNFTKYAMALIGAIMNVQQNQHLHSDDWQRTIYIDTLDVETTDFDLADEKKDALVQSGINGAETYFRWFENPTEAPANRIPE